MPKITAKLAVGVYSLFIGLFMLVFWSALVATNQILPQEIPYAISFHLAGEFATAALLIVSGVSLLRNMNWAKLISPLALGMLLYTVIVSPGYYAQQGNMPMVTMFSILIALTALALFGVFKASK